MKKLVLVMVGCFVLQAVPVRVLAVPVPPQPTTFGAVVLTAGLAVFGLNLFGDKPTAQVDQDEFVSLNGNPAFNHLLKQVAGGSLNTAEILKK